MDKLKVKETEKEPSSEQYVKVKERNDELEYKSV